MDRGRELFITEYMKLRKELGISVYSKDQKWMRLWSFIDWFLRIISFGKMKTFKTSYTTTIGKKIFFPEGWSTKTADEQSYEILRHEAKHVRDFLALGGGNEHLGILVMGFLYLFVPLPIGLAWFRYKFEREAYVESYYAARRAGYIPDTERYVNLLTGPSYLWTWYSKKQVRNYFKKVCK